MDYVDEVESGEGETGVRQTKSQFRLFRKSLVYERYVHEMD
jgi:hypothetical protein